MKLYKVIILLLLFFLCGIFAGSKIKQEASEQRAIKMPIYTTDDIEMLLFNESQL